MGQREEALKELDELITLYTARRQPQELLSALEETVRARPDEVGLHMRLARIYLDLRRRQDAIKELDAVGELQLEISAWARTMCTGTGSSWPNCGANDRQAYPFF